MAKRAVAGELRTKIMVFGYPSEDGGRDADGFGGPRRVNVFGEGRTIHCKWVNAYGKEVYEARQAGVEEPATLTLRYTPRVSPTCLIYKGGDPSPYEVVSVNNVEERCAWLEVKVQRKAAAK